MIQINNKQDCSGCMACYNKCHQNAIMMVEDEKGFKYPKINKDLCIDCGLCDKACPIIRKQSIENNIKAYACYNKNEEVRLQSSSGGIFTLIAEKVIDEGGIVFGVAFDEKFGLKHIAIDNKNDLFKLRTSKYFQSEIGETYKLAEAELKNKRKVLFTGTPCQIEGLLSFLGKKYENLLTQDIICHGVPSPKVWKKYLNYMNEKTDTVPIQINFRQKDNGWNAFDLMLKYKEKTYKINHNNDLFMKAFLRNASLRDSCYSCAFKKKNRLSDITLADFWGIDKIIPEMNDNKGISLVIVNSDKGNNLFNSILNEIMYKEVDFENAIAYNKSMTKSVLPHTNREVFFEKLNEMGFNKLIKRYIPDEVLIIKLLKKAKRVIKKLNKR